MIDFTGLATAFSLMWCLGWALALLFCLLVWFAVSGIEVVRKLRAGDRLTLACVISFGIWIAPLALFLF